MTVIDTETPDRRFVTTIEEFGVRMAGAVFVATNFTKALKDKTRWVEMGMDVEVVARMTGLGQWMDLDGAMLYNGSTWEDNGEYIRPVLVKGIEY